MKRYSILLLVFVFFLSGCQNLEQSKVTYRTTSAISAYNLQYMTASGELEKTTVEPESAQDVWEYSFMADEGEIVYLSGNYKDVQSALKVMILINGKVYKQASNEADTLKFLTVSGTIPYSD